MRAIGGAERRLLTSSPAEPGEEGGVPVDWRRGSYVCLMTSGSNSAVEFLPSKQAVAGSNPVSRSTHSIFKPEQAR